MHELVDQDSYRKATREIEQSVMIDCRESHGYFKDSLNRARLWRLALVLPLGVLAGGNQYRWNMRARNRAGWSNFSERLYFQVSALTATQ